MDDEPGVLLLRLTDMVAVSGAGQLQSALRRAIELTAVAEMTFKVDGEALLLSGLD
jgi:hypothetical protein